MKQFFLMILLFLVVSLTTNSFAKNSLDKYVVCSAKKCPAFSQPASYKQELQNSAIIFETSPDAFMKSWQQDFSKQDNEGWQYILLDENKYTDNMPIIGFGGAFTDSAANLYQHLSPKMKNRLIELYFSQQGIGYTLGRVPIASSDFSCRKKNNYQGEPSLGLCSNQVSPYTYVDKFDPTLNSFALQPEDLFLKIPMLQDALKVATNLRLFASVWSAPAWMKTNDSVIHGSLLPRYQPQWAQYFVKFLQSYNEHHIKFWAVTVENEPEENMFTNGFREWQTMFYTREQEAEFVKKYLGPAIFQYAKSYGSPINIIIHDDQINSIEEKAWIVNDPEVGKYVAGAGIHWYENMDSSFKNLDKAFEFLNIGKPTRFILGTEACQGYLPWSKGPSLGDWSRGESYAHDIISDLNHHVSGWTDWNLMLDMNGGPNWAKNYVDSPILVDIAKQTLYLQPMFFFMGHFSKFIAPNSKQLASESKGPFALEAVSFRVPARNGMGETIIVVVLNRDSTGRNYYIQDVSKSDAQFLNLSIPAHSIQTIIFKVRMT